MLIVLLRLSNVNPRFSCLEEHRRAEKKDKIELKQQKNKLSATVPFP